MGTNRKEINRNMLKGAKDGFRSNGTFRLWAAKLKKGHSFFSIKKCPTYWQIVCVQSGHAASGGGSGVQHVFLCHFELSALRRHIALPHGHQNWIFVAPLHPLFSLHGRLRPCSVRVQVVLEEVRLYKRVGEVFFSFQG